MKFIIPYPPKSVMARWNKEYSLNSIYTGKHWSKRNADSEFWHNMVRSCLLQQAVPNKTFFNPVCIIFRWNDSLDCSNHAYMAKLIEDGLKGYLIKDDSKKYVKGISHFFHDGNYIEVEIQEVIE